MKFQLFTLLFIICLALNLVGQSSWISDYASPVSTVDQAQLKRQNNKSLIAQVRSSKETREPKKFAQPIAVDFEPTVRGTWESIPGDRLLWRFRVKSPEAYSLNLAFKDFYLPPSAHMFIYDINKSYVIGPVTNHDNDTHAEWWSPILPFDEVVIEVQIDQSEEKSLSLRLAQVNHDFSGFGYLLSGSCNVDTKCGAANGFPLIDRYRDVINSVGMYTLSGIELCSGALINTTRNNCTPYFLTAHHCEVRANNAASVVVYWNYENSTCRLPNTAASGTRGNGPRTNFNTGSRLVASYDASDFTLLELDDDVLPEYNPFYAGWDIDGEVFDTTFSIHHPNSEEKRISIDYGRTQPYADQFFMRINGWELGTTEGGSSGAPLFNRDKRIIGQLNGGLAACGNTDFDDYGMIKLSWEGGGTPSTRLKDWLDPDKTGVKKINGRYCRDIVSLSSNEIDLCARTEPTDTITLRIASGYTDGARVEITNVPAGLSVRLSADRLEQNKSVLIIINSVGLSTSYSGLLGVKLTDNFTSVTNFIPISIDVDIPALPVLVNPADGREDINFDIPFEWESSALTYRLQVSENATFAPLIVDLNGLKDPMARVTGLSSNTKYYWRVKAINHCGEGSFSAVSSFTTGNIICTDKTSSDGPKVILEQSNVVRSTISIEQDAEIADLNLINIRGTHSWISDLEFRLIGPNGQKIDLLINGCEDEENFNISFDDESTNINLDCPPLGGKAYRPRQPLSIFDGLSAKGDWTLEITDDVFLDGGSFDSWTIELCLVESKSNRSIVVSPKSIDICQNTFEPVSITASLAGDYDDKIFISLLNSKTNEIIGEALEVASNSNISIDLTDYTSFINTDASLIFRIQDSNGTQNITIPVSFIREDTSIELQEPTDKATGVDVAPLFRWTTGSGSQMTTLQLFDNNGAEIWDTTLSKANSVQLPFDLDQMTSYQWEVTSIGTCTPERTSPFRSFTTTMTTATDDPSQMLIKVYPNPASQVIFIKKENKWVPGTELHLYNMNGQLVRSDRPATNEYRMDVSKLNEGIFILKWIESDRTIAKKVIINR